MEEKSHAAICESCGVHTDDTLLYEMHVKGFHIARF